MIKITIWKKIGGECKLIKIGCVMWFTVNVFQEMNFMFMYSGSLKGQKIYNNKNKNKPVSDD